LNVELLIENFVYRNGDSGFGAVDGGGSLTTVFNSNSTTSDTITLTIINPSTTIVISNLYMTIEWIGGNL
jgi:hypothetical protein